MDPGELLVLVCLILRVLMNNAVAALHATWV